MCCVTIGRPSRSAGGSRWPSCRLGVGGGTAPAQRARVLPTAARCEGPGGGAWPGPGGAAGALTPGERCGLGSRSPGRWGEDASGPQRRARQEARVDRPGVSQLPSPGGGSSEVGGAGRERGLGDHGMSDGRAEIVGDHAGPSFGSVALRELAFGAGVGVPARYVPFPPRIERPLVATTSRLWLQARQHRQARSLATSPQKGSELVSVA